LFELKTGMKYSPLKQFEHNDRIGVGLQAVLVVLLDNGGQRIDGAWYAFKVRIARHRPFMLV
jgi:hypothetical protein